jgi:DmsE family decaheme c-type cytochrome
MSIRRGYRPLAASAVLAALWALAAASAPGDARRQDPPAPAPTGTPAAPGAAATPAAAPTPAAATTPAAASELPKCGDCHTAEVAAFLKNPHAQWSHKDKKPNPEDFCATCHGDGTKHIESGGDPTLIQGYHGVKDAENCLACHEKAGSGWHQSFTTGFHSNSAAVNCLTCHSIHHSDPKSTHLVAKPIGELCETCHSNVSAQFRNKPYAHRLDRGGMTCVDCHDPHAMRQEPVRLTREGELACLTCHADLRGPFVFDHVTGSAGNCLSCHEAHGSNNPKMLQWARVDQLCLSCHSQTGGPRTPGKQPPSFHDLTLPRYRNCTTCHVAIHGSNLSETFLK